MVPRFNIVSELLNQLVNILDVKVIFQTIKVHVDNITFYEKFKKIKLSDKQITKHMVNKKEVSLNSCYC